jgi:hypothetical protein
MNYQAKVAQGRQFHGRLFRNVCSLELCWSMAKLSYELEPPKRGPKKPQAPKLKGFKFNIGIRPKPMSTLAPAIAKTTTTAAAATSSTMATPTATRDSSVECVGAREREQANNDDYDYQTIWYDSNTESLPSVRTLLRHTPTPQSRFVHRRRVKSDNSSTTSA